MSEVQRTLTVPADRDRVWNEVVSGDWLGDEVDLRPVPGSDGQVTDGDEIRHVVVESAEPGRRLVFRWWAIDGDGVGPSTRVTITLTEDADEEPSSTQVMVVEAPVLQTAPLPPSGPLAMAAV